MNQIKFSKNWNNKLNCDYFTTIRLQTRSKKEYYWDRVGQEFSIFVLDKEIGKGILKSLECTILREIGNNCLTYLDAGLDRGEFYKLMETFYKNKPEWEQDLTPMLLLLFKRIKNENS